MALAMGGGAGVSHTGAHRSASVGLIWVSPPYTQPSAVRHLTCSRNFAITTISSSALATDNSRGAFRPPLPSSASTRGTVLSIATK